MKHNYLKCLFTALLLLCTTIAFAHGFEVGGIYYNILSEEDKTVEVTYKGTSYSEYSNEYTGSVTIPSAVTYNGTTYSVTSIGYWAFYNCDGFTNIEIPNSVTSIGYGAFSYCSGLTSIEISNSVTSIGDWAFNYCSGLTNIEIPNSVTSIGERAFYGCSGLTSIMVDENNPVYDSRNNCNAIIRTATNVLVLGCKNTIIPNSVTSIGDYAFSNCSGLTSIEIPNSVTSIGYEAFSGCSGLTNIEIPNSVTSIGDYAFSGCSGLTSIMVDENNPVYDSRNNCNAIIETASNTLISGCNNTIIPNSVTSIGNQAFYNCSGHTNIEIPNSVTSIGDWAFSGCSGLTNIEIPNSVTSIGNHAFYYCSGLTSIEIPNSVRSIGNYAFFYCWWLTSITSYISAYELFIPGDKAFYGIDKSNCTLYIPYGAKETYAATEGWSEFTNIVELEASEITITINQYGAGTYCSPFSLDFSNVEGVKAYSAIGYKPSTQVVTLARVMTTGAGQGIFIKGEPGEYTVPVIDNFDEYTLNMLVGTLEKATVNSTDGTMSNYKFTITDGNATPMFYPFKDNTIFSAGKAYLQIPTAWLPASAQKSISIRFEEGETTDIDEVEGENGKLKGVCYDMQGRVVENPTSGIYIINGKKVIIK